MPVLINTELTLGNKKYQKYIKISKNKHDINAILYVTDMNNRLVNNINLNSLDMKYISSLYGEIGSLITQDCYVNMDMCLLVNDFDKWDRTFNITIWKGLELHDKISFDHFEWEIIQSHMPLIS